MGHRLEVAGSSFAAILGFAHANLCTAQLAAVR